MIKIQPWLIGGLLLTVIYLIVATITLNLPNPAGLADAIMLGYIQLFMIFPGIVIVFLLDSKVLWGEVLDTSVSIFLTAIAYFIIGAIIPAIYSRLRESKINKI